MDLWNQSAVANLKDDPAARQKRRRAGKLKPSVHSEQSNRTVLRQEERAGVLEVLQAKRERVELNRDRLAGAQSTDGEKARRQREGAPRVQLQVEIKLAKHLNH